jgi:Na+-driven multidrug efflux pump
MCLGLPFLTVDFLCVGVFQACGMGSKSLVFAIIRKVVLEIPALYILNKLFSLYGLGYAQAIAELILSIIALAVLKRMIAKLEKNQIAV